MQHLFKLYSIIETKKNSIVATSWKDLVRRFNVKNKQNLPHKFHEDLGNSYESKSYSEVNQKLFNVI